MNFKNCCLLAVILTLALTATSEARGGRGGGGGRRSGGGSRSGGGGGGGWFSGLFGGSSSSKKTSSPSYTPSYTPSQSSYSSNWKPYTPTYSAPKYNSMYHPTTNYGNTFEKGSSRNSEQSDFLSGYMAGSLLSHDYSHNHREAFPDRNIDHAEYDSVAGHGNNRPRLVVITNNQQEMTTTEKSAAIDNPSNKLNELLRGIGETESMDELLDIVSKFNFSNALSHDLNDNHHEAFPDHNIDHGEYDSVAGHGNNQPGLVVITNNQQEMTTTEKIAAIDNPSNMLNELLRGIEEAESMDVLLDRVSKWNLMEDSLKFGQDVSGKFDENSKILMETTTEVPSENAEIASTEIKSLTSDISHASESESSAPNSPQSLEAVTESSLESKPEISTPYGVICAPMFYDEINEFGVNVRTERLGCYPAPSILPI